jgi:hypothetical protein
MLGSCPQCLISFGFAKKGKSMNNATKSVERRYEVKIYRGREITVATCSTMGQAEKIQASRDGAWIEITLKGAKQ